MNARQLEKLGVPRYASKWAIEAIQQLVAEKSLSKSQIKQRIQAVAAEPAQYVGDPVLGTLAKELQQQPIERSFEPIPYRTWGEDIDQGSHQQMEQACSLPAARGAALMPDAHIGYGLPIGGVLALENAVVPYAVGVDIACRMKMSVLDMPPKSLSKNFENYRQSLENGTFFGIGVVQGRKVDHAVFDQDWTVTRITRQNKDKARRQLGTSGSGNHFVEFGTLTITEPAAELDLEPGTYVALLSHSGSRGTGASVCSTYSAIASANLPREYSKFGRLAWLDMDSEEGQEYWAAMNLMGDYAAANHDVIHKNVSSLLGARVIADVENHHNFAWKEVHDGRELIVHRKGATPAGKGVLGVIPGSMADPTFVVRGRGNAESLMSASHGAGRKMSRRAAKDKFNLRSIKGTLDKRGIRVLSAGADEVPGAYKNIESVMAAQSDLVEPIARFDPKIVKMCGDGSRAED
ncbi:RtcB family protein [Roseimaritima sediminicola]|uniref:RtcB family protein n=1 Tax=Roseimaritima sediminicola TaxID=2662066 RepID=UPI0012982F43|nr:RtcB family protein [Roseimaritima sediminicola]